MTFIGSCLVHVANQSVALHGKVPVSQIIGKAESTPIVADQPSVFEPLATHEERPYSVPFFRFDPTGPLLKKGASQLQWQFVAANSMTLVPESRTPVLEEDIEANLFTVNYQHRNSSGWQWGIEAKAGDMGGGFMDPVITWYHHAFLRLTTDRDFFSEGRHVVLGPKEPTSMGGIGLGDASFSLAHSLGANGLIRFGAKLPLGNPNALLGSGSFDLGVEVEQFIKAGKRAGLTLQAAEIHQGNSSYWQDTRPWVYQLGACFSYATSRRDTWSVQYQRESSALNTGLGISDQAQVITSVGYTHWLNSRQKEQFYFSEDFDLFNPHLPVGVGIGPDFTIGASLTTLW